MVKEIKKQTDIIRQIQKDGGYASKWSTDVLSGRPDLITTHPSYETVFVEVKLHKGDLEPGHEVLVKFTKRQRIECNRIITAGGYAFLLVLFKRHNRYWFTLSYGPYPTDHKTFRLKIGSVHPLTNVVAALAAIKKQDWNERLRNEYNK